MTYIEFFDPVAAENVIAGLSKVPERIVFIGNNTKQIRKKVEDYARVFADRGHHVEMECRSASRKSLNFAVKLLTEIVETYDDCVFDVTGGDEVLLLALGIVFARNPDKNIQMQRFNIRNNNVYDYDDGDRSFEFAPVDLTVEECIRLCGGDVVYGTIHEDKCYKWVLTPDFLRDVELIWNVCKDDVRLWNVQTGIFRAIEATGTVSEDGLTTTVELDDLVRYLLQQKKQYRKVKDIVRSLLDHDLITAFNDEDEKKVTVSYKNAQVKKCLTKEGQALEMKVFITAKHVLDEDGAYVYDDVLNGVLIDWDGKTHTEENEEQSSDEDKKFYDTENEIDVLMMHDMVPVFVSCKNGNFNANELYKLESVGRRFGGKYAKLVLVTTCLDQTGSSGEYIRQRARDMQIQLVENIQDMREEELEKTIRNLCC